MRAVTAEGASVYLGVVETNPTLSLIDYSRRVTDDYGVTTIVKRPFARRLTVRLGIPAEDIDQVQRQMAALRSTPATWIADERYASLQVQGLFKDFDLDIAGTTLNYCRLTVEGFAEVDTFTDPGGDPTPNGRPSTLRFLDPVTVEGDVLVSSTVAETDAPVWAAGASYAKGVRVILPATHRIYESVIDGNVGNDPAGASGKWLDVAPTSRVAMFDQALGTATTASGPVEVVLKTGAQVTALALLDTDAAAVRVRAAGFDRTQAVSDAGKAMFFDLAIPAGASVTVTVTPGASGSVAIGTLLIGDVKTLGITEASPTAGITDYSVKETDEFGEVTIVPRAWAKRMSAKALIRSDAVDTVAGRIAAVRARPVLWLGHQGLDSLVVYGFFKDFSIEIGESVSKLSLSIEGLSTAAKVAPLLTSVDWPDVGDSKGTKPADNADVTGDNTSKDTNAVGGRPSSEINRLADLNGVNILREVLRGDALGALLDAVRFIDGQDTGAYVKSVQTQLSTKIEQVVQTIALAIAKNATGDGLVLNGDSVVVTGTDVEAKSLRSIMANLGDLGVTITNLMEAFLDPSGVTSRWVMLMNNSTSGLSGIVNTLTGEIGELLFYADRMKFIRPNGGQPQPVFGYAEDGVLEIISARVKTLAYEALIPLLGGNYNNLDPNGGYQILPGGTIRQWGRFRGTINDEVAFSVVFPKPFPNRCVARGGHPYIASASNLRDLWVQNLGEPTTQGMSFYTQAATRNDQSLDGIDWWAEGN